jgi:hypothetical protein
MRFLAGEALRQRHSHWGSDAERVDREGDSGGVVSVLSLAALRLSTASTAR